MYDTIDRLFEGEIKPTETCPDSSEYRDALKRQNDLINELSTYIPPQRQELIEEEFFAECDIIHAHCLTTFREGFCLGARLMLETLRDGAHRA